MMELDGNYQIMSKIINFEEYKKSKEKNNDEEILFETVLDYLETFLLSESKKDNN